MYRSSEALCPDGQDHRDNGNQEKADGQEERSVLDRGVKEYQKIGNGFRKKAQNDREDPQDDIACLPTLRERSFPLRQDRGMPFPQKVTAGGSQQDPRCITQGIHLHRVRGPGQEEEKSDLRIHHLRHGKLQEHRAKGENDQRQIVESAEPKNLFRAVHISDSPCGVCGSETGTGVPPAILMYHIKK